MSHMRSSQKNRNSRNKGGRNKSSGNVLNRVYESAGPEGKVRGTPQQVIDKYLLLARDAQTSGDRVMAENFLQHAEHYIRLLNAAMPQQNEDRRQPYGNGSQAEVEQGEGQADQPQSQGNGHAPEPRAPEPARQDESAQPEAAEEAGQKPEVETSSALETIDVAGDSEADVVDTPENGTATKPKAEKPQAQETQAEGAEEPKPKPRRRTRRPRNADEVAAE